MTTNTFTLISCLFLLATSYLITMYSGNPGNLLDENGIIEIASALGYFLCAAYILYKGKVCYLIKYHYFFMLVILFGLRELDFDKRFTTMGILKSRFYLSPEVPLTEKLVGFLVIGLLIYIVFSIIKNHFKPFIKNIRDNLTLSFSIMASIALLIVSKTLDGFSRKMGDLGVTISQEVSSSISAAEEFLELGIPIFMLLSFHIFFKRWHGERYYLDCFGNAKQPS